MTTVVKKPSDCSSDELTVFKQLLLAGDEVDNASLVARIQAAVCLVFHFTDNGRIVSISALKTPGNSYRAKVFKQAKSSERADDFPFELGWLFVVEEYRNRGLSRLLAERALKLAEQKNVFAITRIDNVPMCRTNTRLCFQQSGDPYRTTRKGRSYLLSLFIRCVGHSTIKRSLTVKK